MSRGKIFLILLLNSILQATIFSRFTLFGVSVSLSIPIIIGLQGYTNKKRGAYSALLIGFIEDISFSNILGLRALIYFILALIMRKFIKKNTYNNFYGLLMTLISTYIVFISVSLGYVIFMGEVDFISYLKGPIFVEIILNSISYLVVDLIFSKVQRGRKY